MRITVVGAYGYTGLLICKELAARGIYFSITGRNPEALASIAGQFRSVITAYAADINTAEGIKSVLGSTDLVINCAGPFSDESKKLVTAVAQQGKMYLDISGELDFIRSSRIENELAALSSGALLIHGCAFESLPADLAMRMISTSLPNISEFKVFYNFTQTRPSPGTRLTMKLARFREALRITGGNWKTFDVAEHQLQTDWADEPELKAAVPYPLPEISFSEWNFRPRESSSFLLLSKEDALFVKPAQQNAPGKEEVIKTHRSRKQEGPGIEERGKQRFRVIVCATGENKMKKNILLSGYDMYQCTARCIALAVMAIIDNRKRWKGVISPAALFWGREHETLQQLALEWKETINFNYK